MRRPIFALMLLGLLACDQSGITDKGSGTYTESADITQTGDPDFLKAGCDAQGNPVPQVDPRLKAGKVINSNTKIYTEGVGKGEVEFKTEVTAVTANSIQQKYTVTKSDKYYDLAVGDSMEILCVLANGNLDCTQIAFKSRSKKGSTAFLESLKPTIESKWKSQIAALTTGKAPIRIENNKAGTDHSKYEDCLFTAQPQETVKLTKGSYSFSGVASPAVTAFKLTYKLKGDIQCGTETFKAAEIDLSVLTSNDIVSNEFVYCGGSVITQFMKIKAGDKILKGTLTDRTNP
jgi:hypothetical protein